MVSVEELNCLTFISMNFFQEVSGMNNEVIIKS